MLPKGVYTSRSTRVSAVDVDASDRVMIVSVLEAGSVTLEGPGVALLML